MRCPHCHEDISLFVASQAEHPPHNRQRTSRAMAEKIGPIRFGSMKQRAMELLMRQGPMTDDEMQVSLGMGSQSQCPSRLSLVAAGLVRDSGSVRKTRCGNDAIVWEWTGKQPEVWNGKKPA